MTKYYCLEVDSEVEVEVEFKDFLGPPTVEEIAEKAAEKFSAIFAGEGFSDPNSSETVKVYDDKREFLGECGVSVEYYPHYFAREIPKE